MRTLFFINFIFLPILTMAQSIPLEGYVYEENNRGYIKDAKIALLEEKTEALISETISDKDGRFLFELPELDKTYIVVANHSNFLAAETLVKPSSTNFTNAFAKIEMERKPGYVFDVTLSEKNTGQVAIDAITGSRIEIYNNTTASEELVLINHQRPTFQYNFQPGNHYTVMIRKEGYLTKRMEAYVDVDGCILCFDGIGDVAPNVTDVMTHGNEMGTFLANVELEPIKLEKTFKIENIYYDFNKWNIRSDAAEQLDKVVTVLKDNPTILVELGSHTDARGRASYNLSLSQKRAAAAVQYILEEGGIAKERIQSKGYGETNIMNRCADGVHCNEEEHQENRRTELKIIGIDEAKKELKSLKRIIEEEKAMQEVLNSEEIFVPEGENLPENLKKKG